VAVDFRPILKPRLDYPCFKKSVSNITELEEESVLLEAGRSSTRLDRMRGDGSLIVVKSISLSDSIAKSQIESEIANLVSLGHPLIASPIGFAESTAPRRLKIARPYAAGGSLAEVLSDAPAWRTPTAKAKAIAGIALGLRFVHGFGLLHGGVKASTVLWDADRRIQIADFSPIRLETGDAEPSSGEGWSPAAGVCAFASLLSEIAVGRPGAQPGPAPPIPAFVSAIIEGGRSVPHRPLGDRSPIFCKAYVNTVSRFWRALTPRKSAPLSIRLNRASRERNGSKRDHCVRFEKNARVLKNDLGPGFRAPGTGATARDEGRPIDLHSIIQ
jgi:serine/threonine protein kinase